ncbi:hypothetical protein GCK72_004585 [Caenorhabditis remanei]|uniref:Sdz-33 F-box domain-containing protein n=1 Tax=Caenorhabditis remanei TaxID=31234 RepID=A0A6A5HCT8_CAERE|nr:hypothetical protein GCK72_004585 [Caenorhabditis remanei]KAF1764636.1 hypothetical protein GCK72_004585 [Caenorhabditis remanei]
MVGTISEWCMKSIKDTVKRFKVDGLIFTHDCGMECAHLALKNFPEYGALLIDGPAFRNPVEYQDMLIQNMESLTIGIFHDDSKISLDEIFLTNSKLIEIDSRHITDKMINRYLKHWIQGSNPRMENIRIVGSVPKSEAHKKIGGPWQNRRPMAESEARNLS